MFLRSKKDISLILDSVLRFAVGVRQGHLHYDEVTARNNSPPNFGFYIRTLASVNAPSAGGGGVLQGQVTYIHTYIHIAVMLNRPLVI